MSVLDSIPHAIADAPHERKVGIRWWLLAAAITTVLLVGYLATAGLIALVTATATSAQFDPVVALIAALPGWLALHQAALTITGAPLSVLPLLPTALVMLLIASASGWVARRSRVRRPDQAWPVITAMGLVHGMAGTAIAVLLDGPVNAVPVDAFLSCAATATIAATAGVANRCGLVYLVWERVDAVVWSGLRVGLLAFAALIAAGGVVLLLSVCLSAPDMAASLDRSGTAGDAIGATLLSVVYLPNAVLAGWAFAAGTGLSVGRLAVHPLHVEPGPAPDLPLLAVLPTHALPIWWTGCFLLPLFVGVVVGVACRRIGGRLTRRLRAVGVAALAAAAATFVLAHAAGGELGNGPFGLVTLHPLSLAAATLCWIAAPAVAVAWFAPLTDIEDDTTGEVRDEEPDSTPEPGAATETGPQCEDAPQPEDEAAAAAPEEPADTRDTEDLTAAIPHARAAEYDHLAAKPVQELDPTEFDADLVEDDEPDPPRGPAGPGTDPDRARRG
ncbi:cell division protein PerM [Saccharopolyspora thermophila]|uniref:cell division protein PerM n=1 Tax=Saccharopolyspora thermophila TaxID=89367 RepID=UPI0016664574|nr:DUF6350 family protein [Saccharopolyspora subtropica]